MKQDVSDPQLTAVAVLMPTRSLGSIHPECFPALATNQCLRQVVVVVDGAKTVDEEARATALRRSFPQWRWDIQFLGARNGIAVALNAGIDLVECPLTARQDDDDISWPGRLDKQARVLGEDGTLAAIGGWLAYRRGSRRRIRRFPTSSEEITATLPFYNPLAHPTVMVRTQLLRRLRYRPISYCEDYDLWIRAASGGSLRNLPEPLVTYGLKDGAALKRFDHRSAFVAHARLKWSHRRLFRLAPRSHARFLGLIGVEVLFSLCPRWCYARLYNGWLFP